MFQSTKEIEFALRTVRQSVKIAQRIQRELAGEQITKSDQSPVTIADFAIQAYFGHELSKTFPKDALIGEESSQMLKSEKDKSALAKIAIYVKDLIPDASEKKICEWVDYGSHASERFWTLDPVDGTKGYLRNAQYVVALALIEKGKVQMSVLGCPHLKEGSIPDLKGEGSIVIGIRGQGTWAAPISGGNHFKRLHVSSRSKPGEAILLGSVDPTHTDKPKLKKLMELLQVKSPPMIMDSQAKYSVVAGGAGDFFMYLLPACNPDYRMKIWDVAPGALIAEEAGGRTSDLNGDPLDFSCGTFLSKNPGIVISNGWIHDQLIAALKTVHKIS